MEQKVKVKILDLKYDQENDLFEMTIKKIVGEHKTVVLGIAGRDFGISPDVPSEIVEQFCEDMKGKTKNLHIERDYSSLKDIRTINEMSRKKKGKITQEEINRINENIDTYPVNEIMNKLHSEDNINDN